MKTVIVGGPTATGKTEVAVKIAKEFNGELINADSRQIYRYLNIGTNKGDIEENQAGYTIQNIPIHLVNIIDPSERFDLFRYQKLAKEKIKEIRQKGKLPVIVGGTGLYIDSILKGYSLNEEGNIGSKYSREYLDSLSKPELQNLVIELNKKRPESLNDSDWNNPRRLIRFIEKFDIKKPASKTSEIKDFLFLYPKYDWEELKNKIDLRVVKMLEDGLIEETKKVLEMGFNENDPGLHVMGYREVVQYIKGEITLDKCIELIQTAHRQYARRQKTWFEGKGRGYELIKLDFNNFEPSILNIVTK